MSQPLVPCVVCNRHVFVDASACPFCGSRPGAREAPRVPASPGRQHLGRAALLAAGAALVGAAACSSAVPAYGIPPNFDASTDAPSSPGGKGGGGVAGHGGVAGAPAEGDAGTSHLVVAPLSDTGAPMPRKRGP